MSDNEVNFEQRVQNAQDSVESFATQKNHWWRQNFPSLEWLENLVLKNSREPNRMWNRIVCSRAAGLQHYY